VEPGLEFKLDELTYGWSADSLSLSSFKKRFVVNEQKPVALIMGGSSGLSLELARALKATHHVWLTGRKDPNEEGVVFERLRLDRENLHVTSYLMDLLFKKIATPIDLVVFAAGFYQNKLIDELSVAEMDDMVRVSLLAPSFLMSSLLRHQASLPGFIVITSTTQWTPRTNEPLYAASKAGLGMLAHCLSLDGRIKKTLVAGPGGMISGFWRNHPRDTSKFLDPSWVAEQILDQFAHQTTTYRAIRIPRDPRGVEVFAEEPKFFPVNIPGESQG